MVVVVITDHYHPTISVSGDTLAHRWLTLYRVTTLLPARIVTAIINSGVDFSECLSLVLDSAPPPQVSWDLTPDTGEDGGGTCVTSGDQGVGLT